MSKPSIQAVIFDLDGTLVDSNEAHVVVWERVFREAGHPVGLPAIRGQIGKGGDLLVPTLAPGMPKPVQERVATRHGEMFKAEWLPRIRPFAGARELIRRVHDHGAKVVIASSASRAELDHYVELLHATELVDASTSIDDVSTSKPAPDVFGVALNKARMKPEDAIVVGDTPYDIDAAAAAGVRTVAVRSGGFSDQSLSAAMALYDDVAALLAGFAASPLGQRSH
jgi:HAD superfamily hydrolase (TIGR01509 family)